MLARGRRRKLAARLHVSNPPGPKRHLRIGGARLARIVFRPPQTSHVGIGLSVLSYAGEVTVGVRADAALMSQPQRLLDALVAELGAMRVPTNRPSRRQAARSGHEPSI